MTVLELDDAQVLSPGQVARVLGVDPSTVRRWVREGAVPNVFADLPTDRLGIPTWWVAERVCPPAPAVVSGQQVGGSAASLPASAGSGGPHLRTVPGAATPGAA